MNITTQDNKRSIMLSILFVFYDFSIGVWNLTNTVISMPDSTLSQQPQYVSWTITIDLSVDSFKRYIPCRDEVYNLITFASDLPKANVFPPAITVNTTI